MVYHPNHSKPYPTQSPQSQQVLNAQISRCSLFSTNNSSILIVAYMQVPLPINLSYWSEAFEKMYMPFRFEIVSKSAILDKQELHGV